MHQLCCCTLQAGGSKRSRALNCPCHCCRTYIALVLQSERELALMSLSFQGRALCFTCQSLAVLPTRLAALWHCQSDHAWCNKVKPYLKDTLMLLSATVSRKCGEWKPVLCIQKRMFQFEAGHRTAARQLQGSSLKGDVPACISMSATSWSATHTHTTSCRFKPEADDNEAARRWRDGSLEEDLPMRTLSEMFNVNYFMVSQTNPHIVPALNMKRRVNRKLGNLLEAEWKHRHVLSPASCPQPAGQVVLTSCQSHVHH